MFTPIEQKGIYCVVQLHEVEQRSMLGWQLVGIIDAEQVMTVYDQVVPNMTPTSGTGYQGYNTTVATTRNKTIRSPYYLMCLGEEAEIGRLNTQVTEARKATGVAEKATGVAETSLKETKKKLDDMTNASTSAVQALDDVRKQLELREAEVGSMSIQLKEATAKIAKLEERGTQSKPTSFERLMADEETKVGSP